MNGWERRNFLEIEINSFFFFESKLSSFILKGINFWNYEEKEMLLTKLLIPFPPYLKVCTLKRSERMMEPDQGSNPHREGFLETEETNNIYLVQTLESEISQIGKIPDNFQPILWFHFKNSFASGYFCTKKTIKEFYSWNLITNFSFHEHNWFSATFIGLIKRQIHANSRGLVERK